ncbi:hypothetical protein [Hyphococcus luteus]|uniref:Lipoprotein n=1 Tax=Hyphococcus luteus TaxID=2058213 RepID=A0A2S7K043_9PROT|nr:hypothetical protein [Marinicaulis flavus]PQA85831.1 hypothetical protein CW354_20020 [Marinicaulis flavus]
MTFRIFPISRRFLLSLAPLAGLFAAGCASDGNLAELRESPGFTAGYGDGCATATEEDKSFSTRTERDSYAFENDAAYRAGWRQGYLECSTQTPEAKDGGRILGERNEY